MSTATAEELKHFVADPVLLKAIVDSVTSCLSMCGAKVECVGVSMVPTRDSGNITGLIGVHGKVSGFITVNLSEHAAMSAVGGMLQESFDKLNSEVIDGSGEITNIIAGGIKKSLSGTQWGFKDVTIPSVVVGHNYQIAYAAGLEFLSVTFEQADEEALMLDDRLVKVAMSLLRL